MCVGAWTNVMEDLQKKARQKQQDLALTTQLDPGLKDIPHSIYYYGKRAAALGRVREIRQEMEAALVSTVAEAPLIKTQSSAKRSAATLRTPDLLIRRNTNAV